MYYLQSRYYDPEVGRFLNADAYTSTGQGILGNNMFAYCGNNPVNYSDAEGTISVEAAIGAGIVGALFNLYSYWQQCSAQGIETSAEGVLQALFWGAVAGIAGVFAGAPEEVTRLAWSAVSGIASSVSTLITCFECGMSIEEIIYETTKSFLAGATSTYIGAYIPNPGLTYIDEAAFVGGATGVSSSVGIGVSTLIDGFVEWLYYIPPYRKYACAGGKNTGGSGVGLFFAASMN